MMKLKQWSSTVNLQLLLWIVFVILMMFSIIKIWLIPYAGIGWSSDGLVTEFYVPPVGDQPLQLGDRFIRVGEVDWTDFTNSSDLTLFAHYQPGQWVPMEVTRADHPLNVQWQFPGFSPAELISRLINEWFLAYFFWAAGVLTIHSLRPKDVRWWLFIAFNFLTAIWLAAGSSVTQNRVWLSLIVLKVVVWLCLPVYWHLNWNFPAPLGRVPRPVWWAIYSGGIVLALLEALQFLPRRAYYLGFGLAIAGSILLLIIHWLRKPEQRRDIHLILIASAIAFLPLIVITSVVMLVKLPDRAIGGAILVLAVLPFAYLFAAYRRQLGGLELRANRVISLYAFLILLGSLWLAIVFPLSLWLRSVVASSVVGILGMLVAGLAGALGFGPFQAIIENKVLGIRLTPSGLIEGYSNRINISLDRNTLVRLLETEIVPSLLIRQSALLAFQPDSYIALYTQGIEIGQLPTQADVPVLLAEAGKQRIIGEDTQPPCPWVRAVLLLSIDQKPIGLWLLGRRDPDDFYSQREIITLQSLANQTAIALSNIVQAELLHALYQSNVDQREVERERLSRELHDNTLNELRLLIDGLEDQVLTPQFITRYEKLVSDLRQTISDLRPAILNYGLQAALTGLMEEFARRAGKSPRILMEVPESPTLMPHNELVVLHLYRIVQQACENSLRHAQAQTIRLCGQITSEHIDLTVEDDGIGFQTQDPQAAYRIGAEKHFGIAGMYERATIAKAELTLTSNPGKGTRVNIVWWGK